MSPTRDQIAPALDSVLDAQAHNHTQTRLLYNPSPEVDSIIERVAALRAHGVPTPHLRALLADLVAVLHSNEDERTREQHAAGILDTAARVAHQTARCALTAKGMGAALRPLLRSLDRPEPHGMLARRELHRLYLVHGDQLARPAVLHDLGRGPSAVLLAELALLGSVA